jgi:hypothetical protein
MVLNAHARSSYMHYTSVDSMYNVQSRHTTFPLMFTTPLRRDSDFFLRLSYVKAWSTLVRCQLPSSVFQEVLHSKSCALLCMSSPMIRPNKPRIAANISMVRILTNLILSAGQKGILKGKRTVTDLRHLPGPRYCR